ncbi:iron-containing alcohol dehydrogenase [Intestinimonas massiliensis]|uniref:Iron-containing alcohol dehydrogenase n=1 Tax=Intestinimonas massiliensis (ex Afouda et al. 2020) TaxID=1673721 RepID=A0ABS9MB18_9FIRM|nr:iron-containing alcohol dehydrogenase [Intestinimonas massiliensis (ex Afouda et al. 2020)]MCG4527646.1 iron-containing alcohol dehydrogenase [Intestinimonas massiliensis (ex Afouda et al. 2020)]MCQ4807484.1 iron-containing alcohol dehydrogenase [Intestinimonas massiliensis (ex Afouda et al. 2020)]BDE86368.1 putative NADH-dependent butanol dehydrogenase 2 [Oscillospiraceae bacterium]
MEDFVYQNTTKILFGRNAEQKFASEVKAFADRILLVYGGGSIKKNGLYNRIVKQLQDNDIYFVELGGVQPNPLLSLAKTGIELCRTHDLQGILSVGGGSCIDTAKTIAVGVKYCGDVWDFYDGKAEAKTALPIGVILTIPASGSESSDSCVITNDSDANKRAMGSEFIVPRFAVLNPENTTSLSAYQTACGIADIFSHLMERYFTQVNHVDFTDRLLEASMKTLLVNAPKVLKQLDNYDARAEIMWAGTIAHNNLLNTGRIGDWASHMIEHELSGIYDIPHGAGLSIIFPAWMKYVCTHNKSRFIQFAVRVFDVDFPFDDEESIVYEGINRLEAFFSAMGLPTRLHQMNIGNEMFAQMANRCCKKGSVGHFIELHEKDVYQIYCLAK